jgi:hypothetical protein
VDFIRHQIIGLDPIRDCNHTVLRTRIQPNRKGEEMKEPCEVLHERMDEFLSYIDDAFNLNLNEHHEVWYSFWFLRLAVNNF